MKKTIAVLLVMGALFSGNKMYADGNNSNPSWKPAKNIQVSFDNVNPGSKLFVKDSDGQILYTENIHSQGKYSRGFDFSAFPSKDYYFEVDKKAFVFIYPFTVVDEFVELHDDRVREIVKPVLLLENSRVKLMRNLDEDQSINVEIYYEGRSLVYSKTISKDGMIGKVFDFSGSASGEYLFSISYENRNHSEYLSINTSY